MERSPDDDAARVYAYTLLLPHQGPLTAPQPQDGPIQPRATQIVEILQVEAPLLFKNSTQIDTTETRDNNSL